jgi:hypothetical protein
VNIFRFCNTDKLQYLPHNKEANNTKNAGSSLAHWFLVSFCTLN